MYSEIRLDVFFGLNDKQIHRLTSNVNDYIRHNHQPIFVTESWFATNDLEEVFVFQTLQIIVVSMISIVLTIDIELWKLLR
jgi:hypothetical protein